MNNQDLVEKRLGVLDKEVDRLLSTVRKECVTGKGGRAKDRRMIETGRQKSVLYFQVHRNM